MDDIASTMKISKRTLYETYQNKEELLFDVLVDSYKEWETKMELFAKQTDDIMDLLLEFLRLHTEMYANTIRCSLVSCRVILDSRRGLR